MLLMLQSFTVEALIVHIDTSSITHPRLRQNFFERAHETDAGIIATRNMFRSCSW